MTTPEIKFTESWTQHLANFRVSARRIDGEQIQFRFQICLGAKTKAILLETDEWIRQLLYQKKQIRNKFLEMRQTAWRIDNFTGKERSNDK